MSSWGNYDASSNVPYWSAASVHLAPTSTNAGNLYENTTADDFIKGETVGVFGVDSAEVITEGSKAAHAGWVLRTTGSGGRNGRVQEETLVTISKFKTDNNSDDTVYPDAVITFNTNPGNKSFVAGVGNSNTFTVSVSAVPSSATLTYLWQVNDGTGWANAANGVTALTTYSGNTTSSLMVFATGTAANGYKYRAAVTATNAGITNSSAVA